MNSEKLENAITNIDSKYIEEAIQYDSKNKTVILSSYMKIICKAAAFFLLIACFSSTTVYATASIFRKVVVTEYGIFSEDFWEDWDLAYEEENTEEQVQVEQGEHAVGDDSVNWITKDVEIVNGYATNTYYTYESYEKAIADFELDAWFEKIPGNVETITAVLSETPDFTEKSVDAVYAYGKGSFWIYESTITGNAGMAYGVSLDNTGNIRQYTNKNGYIYTLVDEKRDEQITTYVMILYGEYRGFISFSNLTEREIHTLLDQICINQQ